MNTIEFILLTLAFISSIAVTGFIIAKLFDYKAFKCADQPRVRRHSTAQYS